ncbi:hypothetical protein ACS0TY_031733 [Phlomoides rotata]
MAESAVSFLLNQISVVLRDEQQLLGGLEREIEFIQNELGQMREFLRVADANEETNSNLKEWVAQLREISYDVQHVLDKYMLRYGRRLDTNGFIKKFHASIKNMKARRQIASEIQAIKSRLENVSKVQLKYKEMYTVLDQGSSSAISSYDGRCDALFLEVADVVGIEKSKEQILEWIWSMDSDGFEVISLVGMAGLGKTTLVKKVYDDELVYKRFKRHVWIVVSDYTDAKHIVSNLIKKLVGEIKESPPQELECMSIDEMSVDTEILLNFIVSYIV